jgi:MFS family permease
MQEIRLTRPAITSAQVFFTAFVAACALVAVMVGSAPLTASIVTIFLFAGIHNFMEFRYFAARMPLRWGRSRVFYSVGIGGVIVLAFAYLSLYFASGNWLWSESSWATFAAVWNTAFVLWLATLFYLRGNQRPKSDWTWAFPTAFLLAALAWLVPQYWSLALVYIHPFVAMWFLERQIRRTKPEWLRAYHYCLASIPVFLVLLWLSLSGQPNLSEETTLFWRINQHAGSQILPGVSSHLLVATHVFLESIHYFVWILLIPLVDWKAIPWKLCDIPLFAGKGGFPRLVVGAIAVSVLLVVALWFGFAVDYSTTRDVYFAFAIAHVLAEFPFLIKML